MAAGLKIDQQPRPTGNESFRQLEHWRDQIYRCLSLAGSATVDVGNINAGAIGTFTMTVHGAIPGMQVALGPPAALESGLVPYGIVTAKNTVTVSLLNSTTGAINPAEATWSCRVMP